MYVFGDCNSNLNAEEPQGVVTVNKFPPYALDNRPSTSILSNDSSYANKSYILPIVTQLYSEPRVTKDDDIVYLFTDL